MGFFDNVKSSLTETSQDLTQKAKDTTEIFRLGNVNKAKEKEIEKVVYQIGLKFYSEHQDECMDKFPELTTQIKTLQEEIAVNKEMIEKLSVEEVCTNCGKKLNPGSKFCIYCGTPVEKEKKEVKYSGKVCSKCGVPLEEDAAFCTNCGAKVSVEEDIEETEEEVVVEEPVKKVCVKCGAEIEDGNPFCMNCGAPVEE